MPESGLELLEHLIEGGELTRTHVDELLATRAPESQFLEFKSAAKLEEERRKGNAMPGRFVRKYVTGFANAQGGVLLLGLAEQDVHGPNRRLELGPMTAEHDWFVEKLPNYLNVIPGGMYPPPILRFCDVDGGRVLAIAIARGYRLNPVIEDNQRTVYYLRIFDQTLEISPSLIEDLLVGRRAQPVLGLEVADAEVREGRLHVFLSLINHSLVQVRDFGVRLFRFDGSNRRPLSATLRAYVEAGQARVASMALVSPEESRLEALGERFAGDVWVPSDIQPYEQHWCFALCVTAEHMVPQWFELFLWANRQDLAEGGAFRHCLRRVVNRPACVDECGWNEGWKNVRDPPAEAEYTHGRANKR
jgi:hypothetical protein